MFKVVLVRNFEYYARGVKSQLQVAELKQHDFFSNRVLYKGITSSGGNM
jgi:hypothetical protein